MESSGGHQAAALERPEVAVSPALLRRRLSPGGSLQLLGPAPGSASPVPGPWLRWSYASFPTDRAVGIRKLGWALVSCHTTPGNASAPHDFCFCCCLTSYLGLSGIKKQRPFIFITLHGLGIVSSVRQFSFGVTCGCRQKWVGPSPRLPHPCAQVWWLLPAVGWVLSEGP